MQRLVFAICFLLVAAYFQPTPAQSSSLYIQGMNGGGAHNIMLKADGTVWTWGANTVGQLGVGTLTSSAVPLKVALPPIQQVAAGQFYSLALTADGLTIYSFGDNSTGELGTGNSSPAFSATPVKVAIPLPPKVTIVAIADGGNHALALLSTGHVVAWGANEHGQVGQNPATAGNVVYTPMIVPTFANVKSLAAGDHATLALRTDGTLWAWGGNKYGQIGPTPTPSATAATYVPVQVPSLPSINLIATGGEDSIAVDFSGKVYTWGRNTFGELGRGSIDTNDGPHPTPLVIPGLQNIVSVDGEGPFTMAADNAGNIYTFGYNKDGEIGNGSTVNTGSPTRVLTIPLSTAPSGPSVQVSAGHYFSYAFNVVTGQTYSWGQNTYGQLAAPANNTPNPTPLNVTTAILGGVHLFAN